MDNFPLPANTDPTPPQINARRVRPPTAPKPEQVPRYIPNLLNWVAGTLVLLVLFGVLLPTQGRIGMRGRQVKSLAQARTIGLALKQFAGNNDGLYPRAGLSGLPSAKLKNSNEALAMLFPAYVTSESLFGNPLSAYQTRPPDNKIDPAYTGNQSAPSNRAKTSMLTWRA